MVGGFAPRWLFTANRILQGPSATHIRVFCLLPLWLTDKWLLDCKCYKQFCVLGLRGEYKTGVGLPIFSLRLAAQLFPLESDINTSGPNYASSSDQSEAGKLVSLGTSRRRNQTEQQVPASISSDLMRVIRSRWFLVLRGSDCFNAHLWVKWSEESDGHLDVSGTDISKSNDNHLLLEIICLYLWPVFPNILLLLDIGGILYFAFLDIICSSLPPD